MDVFGMKSMKERINIILALEKVFWPIWYIGMLAWDNGRVLDGTTSLPMNHVHVGKLTLFLRMGSKELQLIELMNDLLT